MTPAPAPPPPAPPPPAPPPAAVPASHFLQKPASAFCLHRHREQGVIEMHPIFSLAGSGTLSGLFSRSQKICSTPFFQTVRKLKICYVNKVWLNSIFQKLKKKKSCFFYWKKLRICYANKIRPNSLPIVTFPACFPIRAPKLKEI